VSPRCCGCACNHLAHRAEQDGWGQAPVRPLLTEGDRGENRMFGLPTTTTLIMVGILGFWVVYTIAFYVMTSNWSVEDTDSDHTEVVS
jgi:hypothetical protein